MIRQQIFGGESESQLWLEGSPLEVDANILVTVTSAQGERSAYISSLGVTEIRAGQLVDPAPEVQTDESKRKYAGIQRAMTISGYSIAIVLLLFSGLSFGGVVKARIVLTGSMEPAISPGDIIITTPITRKEPMVGDVIAYQAKRFNGENVAVFSHRIISGDIQTGFVVKGDANKSPDNQKPKAPDILGVVIFVIPFLGNILTPKALFLLVPCIFGLWLIMDAMKSVE
ncbi:sigpep_I_arch, signal peptidase I [Candidatus Nanopelagicaceae bacterium]